MSLLLSSSNLISSHFSISILSSLTISFSKKCHTLGQLSPICPVLSLRALCSSGSEGCALRGVLGKAESNPQRQTACECPLLWFPGRWSLVSNPPFRSLVPFSNPAAESSALGWSPLSPHTCTNTRRCGAQSSEMPLKRHLDDNCCSSPVSGHWGQPCKGVREGNPIRSAPEGLTPTVWGVEKPPQKGGGGGSKRNLNAHAQLLRGISWGWRAQAGRASGHLEPRKGVDATRLPEGAREVGDAVQLPEGGD